MLSIISNIVYYSGQESDIVAWGPGIEGDTNFSFKLLMSLIINM